ncbi:transcription termination/antitermination factor NusG [Candidatus Daviesbacteria bacterium]|nr:transcription termination/antitermination factor NusG [Candidatus Daviesbacteria bacterium]
MESKKPQSDTLKVKSAEDTNSDDEPEEDEEASTKDSEPEDSIPADEETPAEDSQPEEQTAQDLSSTDIPGSKWYVVHTYSGHENRVANALKQRIESEHLENKILDILVPTQEKIEIRAGKKERVKEKIFPGYLMVKMILDDNSWLAVRTTPGVTSFVGIGNKPTPIPESEIKSIVTFMTQGAAPTFKDVFLPSDTVKIIDGPFADFIGKVDTVDKEKGKVRILVSIFGRETPVELDFLQITKL